jgi:hypothetical protein
MPLRNTRGFVVIEADGTPNDSRLGRGVYSWNGRMPVLQISGSLDNLASRQASVDR